MHHFYHKGVLFLSFLLKKNFLLRFNVVVHDNARNNRVIF